MRWTRPFVLGAAGALACSSLALFACGDNALDPIQGGDAGKTDSGSKSDAGKKDSGQPSTQDSGGGGDDQADTGPVNTDAGVFACKRGIASNTTPGPALVHGPGNPGITWWYDWSNDPTSAPPAGIDFVPMVWGQTALNASLPAGSTYLMTFNEPNFKNQSDMTPQQVADAWPTIEAMAQQQGLPILAPGLNFCGNCTDPNITSPYAFLKDFFAACNGCKVDAISVHWYNCDLPSLQAYIDGNASLEGYTQFGKPIWVTEFSCDNSHSPDEQKAYMQAAVPYLESNVNVARYSWFSADQIPNAQLLNGDGSLTDLGQTYVNLPANCAK